MFCLELCSIVGLEVFGEHFVLGFLRSSRLENGSGQEMKLFWLCEVAKVNRFNCLFGSFEVVKKKEVRGNPIAHLHHVH